MIRFRDPARAEEALARIGGMTAHSPQGLVEVAFEGCPNPDQALTYLERWLKASTNPATALQHLLGAGPLARMLVTLLGVSHQLADVLVQNPELAHRLLDPDALTMRPHVEVVRAEVRRLLSAAISYQHRLDRLRFVKQGWTLAIAGCDLARLWPEPQVWAAISDVAEALLVEAAEVVWREAGGEGHCPVAIVGMGKLGGRELNYSSDVDLIYVLPDDVDEAAERTATRVCERLGRAMSDRMGRGAMYRVDLRLRPFGGTGPIVSRFSAIQGYYRRYAETWEHLALIRSRVMGGGPLAVEWEAMRQEIAFPETVGEWALEGLLKMRAKVESHGGDDDLKRGSGGIRDAEFLTQILQMMGGYAHPELRVAGTLQALGALAKTGMLPTGDAERVAEGYTLLRQIEHRIQIAGDQQIHALPQEPAARDFLGRSLGMSGAEELGHELARTRSDLRAIWERRLAGGGGDDPVAWVVEALGPQGPQARALLAAHGEPEAFARTLLENETSLPRIGLVLRHAPALAAHLHRDLALTEQVITGEIEEPEGMLARRAAIERAGTTDELAKSMGRAWRGAALAWVLSDGTWLGKELAAIADVTMRALVRLAEAPLDVVALGSWAGGELSMSSDLDALFLCESEAESAAQRVLAHAALARRAGAPLELDLRLRPEGRTGSLARTEEAFAAYSATDMEDWERFALGRARLAVGRESVPALVHAAAHGGTGDLEGLRYMKHRIETERVPAQYRKRDVKLGWGGLDDIHWLVGLSLIRIRPSVPVGASLPERLATLMGAKALNAAEVQVLRDAHGFLMRVRNWMALLGLGSDVLPENPNKLDSLAHAMGMDEGNSLLAAHREHTETVRAIFEQVVGG